MEASEKASAAGGSGLELRLERGCAYVALPGQPLLDGVDLLALTMGVPEARLPFDVAAGAAQFRLRLCELDRLELTVSAAAVSAAVDALDLAWNGFSRLGLALREGFLEGEGALEDGEPFTFKLGLAADEAGDGIVAIVHEPRLYRPSSVAATLLPARVARCLGALPWKPLPALLRRVLAPRGFKVPRTAGVRLALAAVEPGQLRLSWHRGATAAAPPESAAAAAEGARAFAGAEACLAAGDAAGALAAYRAPGALGAAEPFVVERLLALLAAEPARHDEALALAGAALRQKVGVPALLALAQVHAARGHAPFAASALAEAAALCSRRGEESAALAAAEACLALGTGAEPAAQLRAIDVALGLRRDHLPALRALLAQGERAGDRLALLRACRRLAAVAPEPQEKAAAHARLGALLLAADPPAARLHLDHALRLAPRDPATLALLARVCEEGGEPERAARARAASAESAPLPDPLPALRGEGEGTPTANDHRSEPSALSVAPPEVARSRRAATESARALADALAACDADPDSASPWEALARASLAAGDRAGGARALLALTLRADPAAGAAAALEAARLLDGLGRPADARRARELAARSGDGLTHALERARAAPLDPAASRALSAAAERAAGDAPDLRLRLLARAAAGVARFADPASPSPAPSAAPRPLRLAPELRRAVALPAAKDALAQLLAQLAPWLEPLFPADLASHGADELHRLGPQRSPGLAALVEEAQRALGARGCAAYLTDGDGCEVQHENTRPPSLVLGGGLARRAPAERRFLVARGLGLVDLGWALVGKFSPRDRALLGELACRFAGGSPAAGLPPARARAFLEALERTVPAAARAAAAPLASAATIALAAADPRHLGPALRQTASRWALLHGGDPGAALRALVASERRLRSASHAEVLAHPELRDLAAFAISDAFLDARAAVEEP
ncbi:MAG TPA: hypothetical protein VEM76_02500 [Anaeromyxobacteraceae bacterium]|nr:hypothetical protein [Anaeromyxobacteraceae bacterium]